jgi:hypothetical protein
MLNFSPFLDNPVGNFPASISQGGPDAPMQYIRDIGSFVPITLWGRTSL